MAVTQIKNKIVTTMFTNKAKYIWRVDDVSPFMDWQFFIKYIKLFERYNVIPLIGVIPDNKDSSISPAKFRNKFWDDIRDFSKSNLVEIAQHGYQHILDRSDASILDKRFGQNGLSEFAGLSYEQQYEKIFKGKKILNDNGIETNAWIAPSHSYDQNTIKALSRLGYTSISDGAGLYPYRANGIQFVPQQMWIPRRFPFGVITVCLHPNTWDQNIFKRTEAVLASGVTCIRYSSVIGWEIKNHQKLINSAYFLIYPNIRKLKNIAN